MTKYIEVKSNFIKEKIKQSKFKNRDYIDDLIFLEDYITGKIKGLGFGGAMKLHAVKSHYEKEYIELLKELAPEKLDKFLKEKEKSEKEGKEAEEYLKEEEKQEREDWIKAGGKE